MDQRKRDRDRLAAEAARASAQLSQRNRARAAQNRSSASRQPAHQTPRQTHARPRTLGQFVMKNLLYILSAVAVIAVATLILVIAAPFASKDSRTAPAGQNASTEEAYVSPFDWLNLDRTGGKYAYVVDGQVKSRLGIDVSENQHDINWEAVASDGVEFAMIRLGYRGATEGALYTDAYFETYMEGAQQAGLDRGVYFFSQATTVAEAIEEAEYVLDHLNGVKLEYPVAFDSEESVSGVSKSRTSGLDNELMSSIADAFCLRMEQAGYKTMVYGNAADLSRYKRSSLEGDHVWWAEYDTSSPTAKIDIVMWQYSNNGEVAGISTAVDMNLDLSGAL